MPTDSNPQSINVVWGMLMWLDAKWRISEQLDQSDDQSCELALYCKHPFQHIIVVCFRFCYRLAPEFNNVFFQFIKSPTHFAELQVDFVLQLTNVR